MEEEDFSLRVIFELRFCVFNVVYFVGIYYFWRVMGLLLTLPILFSAMVLSLSSSSLFSTYPLFSQSWLSPPPTVLVVVFVGSVLVGDFCSLGVVEGLAFDCFSVVCAANGVPI